ncbi:amidohydrolase family protein [Azohydromonas caseinilytica]|uniref:Amidohydrolase n=1 Tax=Azohydromonas caseinilytica TaxID=2728836 RepID=A0A848F565_9BURK|nr:amidohydrolase family protein [Azohydromonas caseinilytica]NML13513.1 amidohydrolase [Azohydromonas caseinilytica]
MVIDAHLHCTGRERADEVLRALDEARIDHAVLLAPFLDNGYSLHDPASLRRANAHLAQLVKGHGDRLSGFAVVDPSDPRSPADLQRAIDAGLRGCKMVPSGWYPYDDHVQPLFATAAALKLPLLFHSGIFIDGRSGRFCRPSFYEVLRDHPGVRVALAHVGWPWTDEAIAVALIDRIHGVPHDEAVFRLDISFGPPPPYRREVLQRALATLGAGSLQFGSDCFLPCSGAEVAERRGWVEALMDELALDAATRAQLMGGTALAWLRPGGGTPSVRPADGGADTATDTAASFASSALGAAHPPAPALPGEASGHDPSADEEDLPSPAAPRLTPRGCRRRGWLVAGGPRRLAPICC